MRLTPLTPEQSTTCDLCSKSYQRRDLLLRHRRRCQGPTKPGIRRKACDACVAAKTKCNYSQPTCLRCSKRGIQCQYFNPSDTPKVRSEFHKSWTPRQSSSTASVSVPEQRHSVEHLPPSIDHSDLLTWTEPSMPFHVDSLDIAMSDHAIFGFNALESAMTIPSTQNFTACSQPNEDGLASSASVAWNIPPTPSSCEGPTGLASFVGSPSSSSSLLRICCDYPSNLLKEAPFSPFLHHTFFNDRDSDVTSLPLTSMAVCYGHMMTARDANRFARKAMDAEQQRLIEAFPTYKCVRQWDALHAMLLHEILELRQALADEVEDWRLRPRRKGLRSPFLLKMAQCYASTYPQLCNDDTSVFSDPGTTSLATVTTSWARWKLIETARRTLFLVNMVNFLSYHDQATGKQLPYYEALNDDLILNLPLPSRDAAWLAQNEHEWQQAMQLQPSSKFANTLPRSTRTSGHDSLECMDDTLKSFSTAYSKDAVRTTFGQDFGFDNSDSLRTMIILCGMEQYTQSR